MQIFIYRIVYGSVYSFFFLSFLEYGELRYLELTTISLKKYL